MGSDLYMEEQHSLPKRHAALVIGVRDVLEQDDDMRGCGNHPDSLLPDWAREMLRKALSDSEFRP